MKKIVKKVACDTYSETCKKKEKLSIHEITNTQVRTHLMIKNYKLSRSGS